jgi:hypothetical protein
VRWHHGGYSFAVYNANAARAQLLKANFLYFYRRTLVPADASLCV